MWLGIEMVIIFESINVELCLWIMFFIKEVKWSNYMSLVDLYWRNIEGSVMGI